MKIKVGFCIGFALLMITATVGCSKSPKDKGQIADQPTLQSGEWSPMGESERLTVADKQVIEDALTIQVVSYHDLYKAADMVEKLKAEGYQAYVSSEDLEKQGRWYRVRVGNFKTKEEAEAQLLKLKDKFSDCFIRRR